MNIPKPKTIISITFGVEYVEERFRTVIVDDRRHKIKSVLQD